MRRYAQIIRLRPDDEEEYIRYHADVWPTVLATVADCHIRNYSIFLRNGTLFAYFEYYGDDYAADMRRMAADPETRRWWSIMDPMQMRMDDANDGEKWSELREVFHFEGLEVAKMEELAALRSDSAGRVSFAAHTVGNGIFHEQIGAPLSEPS